MSTPTPAVSEGNPAVIEALENSDDARSLKDHINKQIKSVGTAILQDTFELRMPIYGRKNFTVGALLAFDPEVRNKAMRAGVNIRDFDEMVAIASQCIADEGSRSNPVGEKVAKTIIACYQNGNYR